ncbi:hypothetical protein Scep_029321 [Stephania cephalantha]|uniref:Uncharacterized protein n=1 Tax=Stephania cephalantha TaxID=152367 RepID=A0AAP0E0E7_9MAGN
MGSLALNFSAFLFLFPIGIRRLLCSFSIYLNNPSLYRSKPWYLSNPRCRSIDLFALLAALPIASFSLFFIFFFTSPNHPVYKFTSLQQSSLLFAFWVVLIIILLREFFDFSLIDDAFLFLFAGTIFLIEYWMMGKGLIVESLVPSSRVYDLLAQLALVCSVSCLFLSIKPTAFVAEMGLSLGLVFKGTWVLQAGLLLYSDAFSIKGCRKISVPIHNHGTSNAPPPQCELEEDALRGVALIDLLFVGHAIVVFVLCVVLFGVLNYNGNWRCGEGSRPLMAEIESEERLLTRSIPELEMD